MWEQYADQWCDNRTTDNLPWPTQIWPSANTMKPNAVPRSLGVFEKDRRGVRWDTPASPNRWYLVGSKTLPSVFLLLLNDWEHTVSKGPPYIRQQGHTDSARVRPTSAAFREFPLAAVFHLWPLSSPVPIRRSCSSFVIVRNLLRIWWWSDSTFGDEDESDSTSSLLWPGNRTAVSACSVWCARLK